MRGDERTRFCDQCRLNVYNLSALSLPEIETLLRKQEGRLCVGLYRRQDGTYLVDNCPVGLRALRNGLRRVISGFAAAFVGLVCATGVLAIMDFRRFESGLRDRQPFAAVYDLIWPGRRGWTYGGEIMQIGR